MYESSQHLPHKHTVIVPFYRWEKRPRKVKYFKREVGELDRSQAVWFQSSHTLHVASYCSDRCRMGISALWISEVVCLWVSRYVNSEPGSTQVPKFEQKRFGVVLYISRQITVADFSMHAIAVYSIFNSKKKKKDLGQVKSCNYNWPSSYNLRTTI